MLRTLPARVGALIVGLLFALPTIDLLRTWVRVRRLDATTTDLLEPLGRTVVLAVSVGLTTAVVGTALAVLTERCDLPGRRWWRVLVPLPMVVPSYVGATALLAGVGRGGLLDSIARAVGIDGLPRPTGFWGAWLVLWLFTYPFVFLPVSARLARSGAAIEESARLLGRGRWGTLWAVVLPSVRTTASAGGLLSALYALSDVGAVDRLRYSTLARELYLSRLDERTWVPLGMVLAGIALSLSVVERLGARRGAVAGAARGGSRVASRLPLGRWRWPAAVGVASVVGAAILGPVSVLAWWLVGALRGGTGSTFELDMAALVAPVRSTVLVAVAAAVVAVGVVLPVARLARADRRRTGRVGWAPTVASVLIMSGYALPGLVVALALVTWVLDTDLVAGLYQSITVLIAAYVVHFGAQAARATSVAADAVPDRLVDASRLLGAGWVRRLVRVEVPLMAPGLLVGGGLVALSVMKELPATLLLAPIGFRTLATTMWDAYETGSLAQTSLVALVLVAVSGVLTWSLVLRRIEHS